jgi:DNA-binding NtrC family response regulator
MAPSDSENLRILLVGESDVLEKRLKDALTADGFDSETVESGCDCLKRVTNSDIDGIISEYALSDIDGIELLKSVRVSYPDLPFVLVPDADVASVAGDAIAAGVSGYALKQSSPVTVVSRLQESLQQVNQQSGDESRDRYRHIVEMSPTPINLFDGSGEALWFDILPALKGEDSQVGILWFTT